MAAHIDEAVAVPVDTTPLVAPLDFDIDKDCTAIGQDMAGS